MGASTNSQGNHHTSDASAHVGGMPKVVRRKYGDSESPKAEPGCTEAANNFCQRGRLAVAEGRVCTCAVVAAAITSANALGREAVAFDLIPLAMLLTVCWQVEGLVRASPLYRRGADPGTLLSP
jgi:hypothetical protein